MYCTKVIHQYATSVYAGQKPSQVRVNFGEITSHRAAEISKIFVNCCGYHPNFGAPITIIVPNVKKGQFQKRLLSALV
jgi:hypothetical protein